MPLLEEDMKECAGKEMIGTEEALALLNDQDFTLDYLRCSRKALIECAIKLFENHGMVEKFKLNEGGRLRAFITDVASHYNKVIFHNFAHAFNVLHSTSIIWNRIDHEKYFDDLDLLLLLVGTICHDLDHFGLGNTYFVKSGHPLAQTVSG